MIARKRQRLLMRDLRYLMRLKLIKKKSILDFAPIK